MSGKVGLIVLGVLLIAPVASFAQENRRYEDKEHHDTHEWNDKEKRAYHRYLQSRHRSDHDFGTAPKREQADYWAWRHAHPDRDRDDRR